LFAIELFSHLLQSLVRTTNGAGCHLYTDKFYTSYELARETRNLNICLTEIVLGNRMGLPAEAVPLNMAVSEVKIYYNKAKNTVFLGWRDKRNLLMLSTFHAPGTQMIRCKERSGKICEYRRPFVMCDYTSKLSAVEQTFCCSSCALMCERYKWWCKIYVLDLESMYRQ
jgi:hypothetical protein